MAERDLRDGHFLAVKTGVMRFDDVVKWERREAEVAYIDFFGGFVTDFVSRPLAVSALQEE